MYHDGPYPTSIDPSYYPETITSLEYSAPSGDECYLEANDNENDSAFYTSEDASPPGDSRCSRRSHPYASVTPAMPKTPAIKCKTTPTGRKATPTRRRRRVITVRQRRAANVRERKRMTLLNESFDRLRTTVPTFAYEKKLSRIDTLRLASGYIEFMMNVLNVPLPTPPSPQELHQKSHHQPHQQPHQQSHHQPPHPQTQQQPPPRLIHQDTSPQPHHTSPLSQHHHQLPPNITNQPHFMPSPIHHHASLTPEQQPHHIHHHTLHDTQPLLSQCIHQHTSLATPPSMHYPPVQDPSIPLHLQHPPPPPPPPLILHYHEMDSSVQPPPGHKSPIGSVTTCQRSYCPQQDGYAEYSGENSVDVMVDCTPPMYPPAISANQNVGERGAVAREIRFGRDCKFSVL